MTEVLSYRNQSNELQSKSMDWFLHDRDLRHERVKEGFFSVHTYTNLQFEQLHKYIQNRNKIYKKWYTQKQL